MRFKFDENLPAELGALLRHAGHEAHSVHDENLSGADDPSIAKVCQAEQRILITLDLDFADLKHYPPQPRSSPPNPREKLIRHFKLLDTCRNRKHPKRRIWMPRIAS